MFITPKERTDYPEKTNFGEKGTFLLQNKQYTEAYIFLSQALVEKPEDVSIFFNLGLCCLFAGNAEKALQYLDAGLEKLNTGALPQEPKADPQMLQLLEKEEAGTDSYKEAMASFEAIYFFKRTRDRFLRLIIDSCVLTGNTVRIKQIADMLRSKSYKNVQEALKKT